MHIKNIYKRNAQANKKATKKAIQALIIILIFSMVSCATWEGKKRGGSTGRRGDSETSQKWPAEKEVKRPQEQQLASIDTPARQASMNMVTKGKKQINSGKYHKALHSFQEAVIIDSANGVAYYYMAKARYHLEQFEEAMGILDKAESILSASEQWMETISMLRSKIQESYLASEGPQITDDLIPIINVKE